MRNTQLSIATTVTHYYLRRREPGVRRWRVVQGVERATLDATPDLSGNWCLR